MQLNDFIKQVIASDQQLADTDQLIRGMLHTIKGEAKTTVAPDDVATLYAGVNACHNAMNKMRGGDSAKAQLTNLINAVAAVADSMGIDEHTLRAKTLSEDLRVKLVDFSPISIPVQRWGATAGVDASSFGTRVRIR